MRILMEVFFFRGVVFFIIFLFFCFFIRAYHGSSDGGVFSCRVFFFNEIVPWEF